MKLRQAMKNGSMLCSRVATVFRPRPEQRADTTFQGYGQSLSNLTSGRFPTVLIQPASIPLPNRTAEANLARAQIIGTRVGVSDSNSGRSSKAKSVTLWKRCRRRRHAWKRRCGRAELEQYQSECVVSRSLPTAERYS